MQSITSLMKDFFKGLYDYEVLDHNWPLVFKKILEYQEILNFEKRNIHTLWTVNGGNIRRKIKNDKLVAQVLSLTLPGYIGEGLTLYRGECSFLYDSGQIGFCWTPEIDVAIKFASGLNAYEKY